MKCTVHDNQIDIETSAYRLSLAVPPETSYLLCKKTSRLFAFVAGGDCSITGKNDASSCSSGWQMEEESEGHLLCFREEKSSLWSQKKFLLDATETALEWHHELRGSGAIEEIRFFRSCYEGAEYGFSGDFDEIYSVAPNFREQQWFHPTSKFLISYGTDSTRAVGMHALASVPHAMGLHDRRDEGILSVGAFAMPGEYLWDEFAWNPDVVISPTDYFGDDEKAGGFAIRYFGKKQIEGEWSSPCLAFTFPDHYGDTLKSALEYAYGRGYLPRPGKHRSFPWWKEPIYCTWDDQTSFTAKDVRNYGTLEQPNSGVYCTQELTDRWLNLLIDHGAKPGIVVLDDKWQKSRIGADPDTDKWPSLRRWIDGCHEKGIRVFLWGLAWQTEDVPFDEAILRDGKTIVAADITNPKYEARFREKIRRYFSPEPDCLNADGVKIDGLLALPVGRGLTNYRNVWGLELQKYYLKVVYEAAKKIREDVCISVFTANPYLDECADMVRLADMYTHRLSTADSMQWRRGVYAVTNPDLPVDTDSQLNYDYVSSYREILERQGKLGIPSVYNAQYVRRGHFFFSPDYRTLTEDEYREMAEAFRRYRRDNGLA